LIIKSKEAPKMALAKVLARDWVLYIANENILQYIEVKGLTNLIFDREKTDADTTDFNSDGQTEHLVASRGIIISLEGYYLEDQSNGDRDPGQSLVEDLSELVGANGIARFILISPAGIVRHFNASANVTGTGGGNDDPTGWKCTLNVSGEVSLNPVAVTGISVLPATLTLTVGQISSVLTTTFTPVNATNKALTSRFFERFDFVEDKRSDSTLSFPKISETSVFQII
jgi:hypothetical protein